MTGQPAPRTPARRRRADAERSIDAILDAALDGILADGEVNMAAIARAAGVSRVTLYAHFPTREAVLEASISRALGVVGAALGSIGLAEGPAPEALSRLLRSSWQVLERYRNLYSAATLLLPAPRLRELHDQLMGEMDRLVERGQRDGDFRADLPRTWLVATIYALMHQAAEEVNAGRLAPGQAGDVMAATARAVMSRVE